MAYNLTSRLQNTAQIFRSILKANQRILSLTISSRKLCSDIPSSSHAEKYEILKNRLAVVPYLEILSKGGDVVKQDLYQEKDERLEEIGKWFAEVFEYNTKTDSRMVHSVCLLKTFCVYGFDIENENWNQWDSTGWKSAVLLGWCTELIRGLFNVHDDVMDHAALRRGKPCWYRKPEVGLCAINDGLLLECGVYKLLLKHFGHSENYLNILHECIKSVIESAYGQCIDMRFNARARKEGFEKLTMDFYKFFTDYKSSPLAFTLPIHLGMHLAGGCSAKEFELTKLICEQLGFYFMIQDDYADSFSTWEPKHTGTLGNDIREGKCTWLSVKFCEDATESMKKTFLDNYGLDDKDSIAIVQDLYIKSHLREKFWEFDEKFSKEITALIESMDTTRGYLFHNLFSQIRIKAD